MEWSEVCSLTRTGKNEYALRIYCLPRMEVQEMREKESDAAGCLEDVFLGLPVMDAAMEGRTNFILPDNGKLRLCKLDKGREFVKQRQFNGTGYRGTQPEVMAQMRESLWGRGYHPRPCACFRDVDVLKTLQKIMEHNTEYYQTDFQYDRETLTDAAKDRNAPKRFFWLTRRGGTHCFMEEHVYLKETSQHNSWNSYGSSRGEHPRTFWVELQGQDMEEDGVRGSIFEIDYQKHLDYLSTHSVTPDWVDIVFQNRPGYQTFGFQEYWENWQSIGQEYGRVENVNYGVKDPELFHQTVLEGREIFLGDAREMEVEDYVKLIDKERLHGYGYTMDDLFLTGPLDTEKAIQHGLECFMLNQDNSKERIPDHKLYEWAVSRGKLFGMPAREKEILEYLKQDACPLFTKEEIQKIYTLVLQAGIKNEPGEKELRSILRKAECLLPEGMKEDICGKMLEIQERVEEMEQ
ncbi:MAG: hypothetical protein HFG79_16585 [Lachnospiraceae bacterium]|jgi:hypothetical protein|nr:hypothetical protein [Lachnospiraceae bacterium]